MSENEKETATDCKPQGSYDQLTQKQVDQAAGDAGVELDAQDLTALMGLLPGDVDVNTLLAAMFENMQAVGVARALALAVKSFGEEAQDLVIQFPAKFERSFSLMIAFADTVIETSQPVVKS